jgi:HSP20 family protein
MKDWDFDSFFDRRPARFRSVERAWSPAMDLAEHEDHFFVRMDLPGLDKGDVEIKLQDSELTVSGERKQEEEQKKDGYYHCERAYGKFERTLSLPNNVDVNKVEATFKNGLLEIRVPKSEEAKTRQVEIKG